MLISKMTCKEGLWTGRPDLGFWCSKQQPPISGDLYCHFHMQEEQHLWLPIGWNQNEESRLPIKRTNKKRKSEQQAKPFDK